MEGFLLDLAIEYPRYALVVFLMMGMAVAGLSLFNWYNNKRLAHKYHQIDKTVIRLCDHVYMLGGPRIVRNHRNGDHEIINPLFDEPAKEP